MVNTSGVWENENCCGNTSLHEPARACTSLRIVFPDSNFEFSQTSTSVTITLWKHRENVIYCFCEIKAGSNFLFRYSYGKWF